ncbi:hypothetical protein HPG69_007592 [Diceros bicornis minor]|uniref:Uncharacterized protein n=1 Tax=Diceros bicornis minor TaxID=77932 RepID=A0A7J7EUT1_DICBM|nr:hypothetical protein HPG69_007592 [Diceros bicornis minor]
MNIHLVQLPSPPPGPAAHPTLAHAAGICRAQKLKIRTSALPRRRAASSPPPAPLLPRSTLSRPVRGNPEQGPERSSPGAGDRRRRDPGLRLIPQREEGSHRGAANPKVKRDCVPNFLTAPTPTPGAHHASPACRLRHPQVSAVQPDSCRSPSTLLPAPPPLRLRARPRPDARSRGPHLLAPPLRLPLPSSSAHPHSGRPYAPRLPPVPVASRPGRGVSHPAGLSPALPSSRKLPLSLKAQESRKDLPNGRSGRLVRGRESRAPRPELGERWKSRALCPGPPRLPCCGGAGEFPCSSPGVAAPSLGGDGVSQMSERGGSGPTGPRGAEGKDGSSPCPHLGRTFVADAALPVLGRLAAADELELVGREPLAAVADGRTLAALAEFAHVEQRAIGAALHLDARLAVVQQRLEIRCRGRSGREALEGQRVPGQVEVRGGLVQAQVGARGAEWRNQQCLIAGGRGG